MKGVARMTPSVGTPAHALTMTNPWSMVPALGNLDAYISAVNRLPLLTPRGGAGLRTQAA